MLFVSQTKVLSYLPSTFWQQLLLLLSGAEHEWVLPHRTRIVWWIEQDLQFRLFRPVSFGLEYWQWCTRLLLQGRFCIEWWLLCTTTNATVGKLKEIAKRSSWFVHNQRLFDSHFTFSELILNDSEPFSVRIGEHSTNDASFSCSKEPNQQINFSFLLIISLLFNRLSVLFHSWF